LLIPIVLLAELIFWKSKWKPAKNESTFWFTAKRKGLALIESAWWIIQANGLYNGIRWLFPWIETNQPFINELIYFFGWGTLIIGAGALIFYVWIKLNTSKYKDLSKRNKKKELKK
jgi:hypothetical protein